MLIEWVVCNYLLLKILSNILKQKNDNYSYWTVSCCQIDANERIVLCEQIANVESYFPRLQNFNCEVTYGKLYHFYAIYNFYSAESEIFSIQTKKLF